jgi:hypothetical protein
MPSVEVEAVAQPSRGPRPKKKRRVEKEAIVLSPTTHDFTVLPDAALRGAVVAARTLRSLGDGSRALVAVKALWQKILRTPGLTEIYAAIEEDNPSGGALISAIQRAEAVRDAGIAACAAGEDWEGIESRRARLERRLTRASTPPPANPRNTRPAHQTRFVRP